MNKRKIGGFVIGAIFYSFAFLLMDLEFWRELLIIFLVIIGSHLQNALTQSYDKENSK